MAASPRYHSYVAIHAAPALLRHTSDFAAVPALSFSVGFLVGKTKAWKRCAQHIT